MIDVKNKDPQKEAVYENKLCGNVNGETISHEGVKAIREAIWEEHIDLPLREPSVEYDTEEGHAYFAWDHKIVLGYSKSEVKIPKLLHEMAHAKLGALGIGPFVETHGPFFLRIFGEMWSTFAAKPKEKIFRRCKKLNLQVADKLPPGLDEASWALVQENGKEYAVRPAQKAVEMGWNIKEMFSTGVAERHPMGINNTGR